jgi:ABC-type multidrug transport system ATPase subunit
MQLKIKDLTKTYPNGTQALKGVSLTISKGMFGLLGPNGAGKSTLMRIVATLQSADSGSVHLGDIDVLANPHELRKRLGYLPQEFGVYPRTSARRMLNHLAILKGVGPAKYRAELVNSLLDRVNLRTVADKRLTGFSGGMRQRFGIAQALLGSPELLIVDEPTAGLDPGERNRFYNLLAEIGEQTIVILSTHIVQDVKELCTEMAIINQGQLLFAGQPADAESQLEGKVFAKSLDKSELSDHLSRYDVISTKLVAGRPLIHAYSESPLDDNFVAVAPDLEDVFFSRILQSNRSSSLPTESLTGV